MKSAIRLLVAVCVAFVAMLATKSAQAQNYREVPGPERGAIYLMINGNVVADDVVPAYDGIYRKSLEAVGDLEPGEHLTWEKIYRAGDNAGALIPVCLKENGIPKWIGGRGDESGWRNCNRPSWVAVPGLKIKIPTQQMVSYDAAKAFYMNVRSCLKGSDCSIGKVKEYIGGTVPVVATPPKPPTSPNAPVAKTPVEAPKDDSAEVAELKARVASLEKANNRLTSERDVARKDRDDLRGKMKDAKGPSMGMPTGRVVALAVILICAAIIIGLLAFRRGKTRGRKIERKKADVELGTMQLNYQEEVTDRDNRIATLQCEIVTVTHALEAARAEKLAPSAEPSVFVPVASGLAVAASVAAVATISAMEPTLPPQHVDAMAEQVLSPELMKTMALPDANANGNGDGARRNLSVESLHWTREQRDEYDRDKRSRNAGTPVVAPANGQNGHGKNSDEGALFEARIIALTQEVGGVRAENATLTASVNALQQARIELDAQVVQHVDALTAREAELASANAAKNRAEGELAAARLSREQVDAKLHKLRVAWHDQGRAVKAYTHDDSEDPLFRIGMMDDPTLGGRPRGEPALDLGVAQASFYAALAAVINDGATAKTVAADMRNVWLCAPPMGAPPEARGLPLLDDLDEVTTVADSGSSKPPSSGPLTFTIGGSVDLSHVFSKGAAGSRAKQSSGPPPKGRTAIPPALVPTTPVVAATEPSVSGVHISPRKGDTLPPPPPSRVAPQTLPSPNGGEDRDASDQRLTLPDTPASVNALKGDAEPSPAHAGAKV